ncbi:MAG: flagellar biosynthesis protein FlhF, partial [Ignavibacteriales bacterium]
VEDIRQKVESGSKQKSRTKAGQMLYRTLIANQVDDKLATKIVKTVEERMEDERRRDISVARELGIQVIMDMLKKPRAIEVKGRRARIVALIGPTGVGKTTTIAKLAANFSLLDKRKVGLITLDTYRIAAVEQLKTYAEIIGVPLEVVFNPEDLKTAIKSFAKCDIVFIDTAGRSPRNETQMEELSRFLETSEPDEVILVLSATTRTEELIDAYRKFNVVKIDKIVFTKLDETTSYGQILSTIYKTRSHISYITNGQNVPDDIELPDEMLLAKLILGDGGI